VTPETVYGNKNLVFMSVKFGVSDWELGLNFRPVRPFKSVLQRT